MGRSHFRAERDEAAFERNRGNQEKNKGEIVEFAWE